MWHKKECHSLTLHSNLEAIIIIYNWSKISLALSKRVKKFYLNFFKMVLFSNLSSFNGWLITILWKPVWKEMHHIRLNINVIVITLETKKKKKKTFIRYFNEPILKKDFIPNNITISCKIIYVQNGCANGVTDSGSKWEIGADLS